LNVINRSGFPGEAKDDGRVNAFFCKIRIKLQSAFAIRLPVSARL
jgi:hypothetical protein